MRIAILAHNLRVAGGLSVGRNIVASLGNVAPEHEYMLAIPAGAGYEALSLPPRSEFLTFKRKLGPLGTLWFERHTLPKAIRRFGPDVIWGLGNVGIHHPGCHQAILLHNRHYVAPINLDMPHMRSIKATHAMGRRRLRNVLPHASLIFCQTKAMQSDFLKWSNFQGPIPIMPNGVPPATAVEDNIERPEIFKKLGSKFVLFCLTRYYAHKNLEAFVDLFKQYSDQLKDVVVLVTVAPDHAPKPLAKAFIDAINQPGIREHVINVGPLSFDELPGYFTASDALILPTLIESFTGTYLEAMQFKCPILTSDRDFAHEICDDAAHYFDPLDSGSIRDAIVKLRDDEAFQDDLRERGTRRRAEWVRDWDDIVKEALEEIYKLVNSTNTTKS